MVEAISEETSNYAFTSHEREEMDPLCEMVCYAIPNRDIALMVLEKINELGFDRYEEKLGEGAFGIVLRLKGSGNKDIALKLEKRPFPLTDENQNLIGDAQALNLPAGKHLGRAKGLLTLHNGEIHYIETFDPKLHVGHILVGVLSTAVDGVTFGERISKAPLDSEAVKGYGKRLAEALHALHEAGYVHNDLHMGNILAKNPKEGKDAHRIKLLDFGLAKEATEKRVQSEWKRFAQLLLQLDSNKNTLHQNPAFRALIYTLSQGYPNYSTPPAERNQCHLNHPTPLTGKEILNHPFFA